MLLVLLSCVVDPVPMDTQDTVDTWETADDTADTSDTGQAPVGTRGVWAWRDAGDPHGTDAIVGDPVAEDVMIATLQGWGVSRVYGSYGDRPVTEPQTLADWNAKLDAAGIESHVLLGDPAWISSREWASMLAKIDARLLEFNAGRTDPAERFDGLHLDIEPQAGAGWSAASEADKLAQLGLLDATYDTVRVHLDASGAAALPVEADLAVWFDNLPPSLGGTGSVGWTSVAERDAWFGDLPLQGVSMMAYERDDAAVITAAVADETALFSGGPVRVGLNEEVGTTWATLSEMFAMADGLENQGVLVDLHSYSAIRALTP